MMELMDYNECYRLNGEGVRVVNLLEETTQDGDEWKSYRVIPEAIEVYCGLFRWQRVIGKYSRILCHQAICAMG